MIPMWRGNSGRSERDDVGRMGEDMAFLGRTRGIVVSKQKASQRGPSKTFAKRGRALIRARLRALAAKANWPVRRTTRLIFTVCPWFTVSRNLVSCAYQPREEDLREASHSAQLCAAHRHAREHASCSAPGS